MVLGVPTIAVPVSDNQIAMIEQLSWRAAVLAVDGFSSGSHADLVAAIERLVSAASPAVDGAAGERLVGMIENELDKRETGS